MHVENCKKIFCAELILPKHITKCVDLAYAFFAANQSAQFQGSKTSQEKDSQGRNEFFSVLYDSQVVSSLSIPIFHCRIQCYLLCCRRSTYVQFLTRESTIVATISLSLNWASSITLLSHLLCASQELPIESSLAGQRRKNRL